MGKFICDFLLFAALSVLALLLGLAMVSTVPAIAAPFLTVALVPLLLIGPVAVLILAAVKRRPGRILGALAGIPALLLYHQIGIWQEVAKVDSLNQREFLPPKQQHEILLIEGRFETRSVGLDHCRIICQQILLSTPYVVVFDEKQTGKRYAFRPAHGAACRTPEMQEQYIALLGRRVVDFCAVRSEIEPSPDALVIREEHTADPDVRKQLPWRTVVHELSERIGGTDRLLGRWIWAAIDPSTPWFGLMGVKESSSTQKFTIFEFYSAALKTKIEEDPKGPASLDLVISELRPYFSSADLITHHNAGDAVFVLVTRATPEEKPHLRELVRTLIADLEKSADPPVRELERLRYWAEHLL
jgi:hypothetical protein